MKDRESCQKFSPSGKFIVQSAYAIAFDVDPVIQEKDWINFWKCKCPPKIEHFLWLARLGKLLTNKSRRNRHFTMDSSYSTYGYDPENAIHVLRDCALATHIWKSFLPVEAHSDFFASDLKVWIDSNLCKNSRTFEWQSFFTFASWFL